MIFKSSLSTILVCGYLLISLTSTASAQNCVDSTGSFRPDDPNFATGKKRNCQAWVTMNMCSDDKVKEKCCVSCPDTETSPTSSPPVCSDSTVKFVVPEHSDETKRKCPAWVNQTGCDYQRVRDNCCASCEGTHTPPAPTSPTGPTPIAPTPNSTLKDQGGKFKIGKKTWTCKKIRNLKKNKRKNMCKKGKSKKKCRLTCRSATKPPTPSPTLPPTDQPTSEPSTSPTSQPSTSPTSTPTSSPTSSPPTSSPISTSPQCTITSTVTFPPASTLAGDGTIGYSESSLRVINNDMDEVCSTSHDETVNWNCVHRSYIQLHGDDTAPSDHAHVYATGDPSTNEQGSVTAVIQYAAGANYTFFMGHIFTEYEQDDYYKYDHLIKSSLAVSVGNTELGPFESQNEGNIDTHVLNVANPLFDDSLILDVECNDDCKCTAAVRSNTCRIRAEISHPDLTSLIAGYHADTVSVGRKDEYDVCSQSSTGTKWCEHEGYAEYNYDPDSYYDDYSTTESIVIPDAADGEYLFKVSYNIADGWEDDVLTNKNEGTLAFHVEGEDAATEYNHLIDGKHFDTFYLAVSCSSECECTVVQKATLDDGTCEIRGKLEFPGKKKVKYLGYHNDYLSIEREGKDVVCSEDYRTTSWGCTHNSDAFVEKTESTFDRNAESFLIDDIADKSFRVTIKHWFDESKENKEEYPDDHKLFAEMGLKFGDGNYTGSYRKPDNNYTDTHIVTDEGDVVVNPEFKDETYVDISCNEFCGCDVKQYDPVCQLDAELSFPAHKGLSYFYNEEFVVAVDSAYPEDTCEYQKLTNWGCISYDDAYLYQNDLTHPDYNGTQILQIPDASNRDVTFTVTHADLLIGDTGDYKPKDATNLDVRVNGNSIGIFPHKKVKSQMFEGGVVVVDGYESEMTVEVSCDENCVCTAVNPNEE